MDFKDYYAVLGVPKTASQDEVRRAYRKLARTYHPDVDKNPGAEERFKELGEAYAVLSDPEKRAAYGAYGTAQTPPKTPEGGWSQGDVNPSDFSEFFQGLFGTEDLFGSSFGDPGVRHAPRRGYDSGAELVLPLEVAYRGGEQTLRLDGETLNVTIPPGVREGSRVRLAGKGSPGNPPGDLYLTVRLAEHPRLRLEGDDLHATVEVPAPLMVVGGEVRVPTLDGLVEMRVPPRSRAGRRLRLREKGWPKRGGGRGDAYVHLQPSVPGNPSPEEERLYRQLAEHLEGVTR